jgi:hypothetical protein
MEGEQFELFWHHEVRNREGGEKAPGLMPKICALMLFTLDFYENDPFNRRRSYASDLRRDL